jgi:hypothetical protein
MRGVTDIRACRPPAIGAAGPRRGAAGGDVVCRCTGRSAFRRLWTHERGEGVFVNPENSAATVVRDLTQPAARRAGHSEAIQKAYNGFAYVICGGVEIGEDGRA